MRFIDTNLLHKHQHIFINIHASETIRTYRFYLRSYSSIERGRTVGIQCDHIHYQSKKKNEMCKETAGYNLDVGKMQVTDTESNLVSDLRTKISQQDL